MVSLIHWIPFYFKVCFILLIMQLPSSSKYFKEKYLAYETHQSIYKHLLSFVLSVLHTKDKMYHRILNVLTTFL